MPNYSYNSTSGTYGAYFYNYEKREWVPATVHPPGMPTEAEEAMRKAREEDRKKAQKEHHFPSADLSPAQVQAESEYIEVEYNTLQGELSIVPTDNSLKIKVGDTIKLKGVGKYLSGLYFVSEIKRTIGSDGYNQTLTVIKTGFGDSLKKPSQTDTTTRSEEVPKTSGDFKVGDKVKIVGDDAVYSNASDGVKVPDWVKEQILTIDALSDDGTRARLNPIWSWTYTKFLQKV